MKQKVFTMMMMCMLYLGVSHAQTQLVRGQVRSARDDKPLAAVSVRVEGTNIGQQTDETGHFSLYVEAGGRIQFSALGYLTQTVSLSGIEVLTILMQEAEGLLQEVVVTGAYGIQQSARASSSSAQFLDAKTINVSRQPNLNNALAGKVAGLQVRSQSAAALGRSAGIRLRGATGLSLGNEGAIYVVDGTILTHYDDVSVDDIASVTVLQGPAASAQFGAQGANGAVVITTKRQAEGKGEQLLLNMGLTADQVYVLPAYQDVYAGGSSPQLYQYQWVEGQPQEWRALDGKYYHDYSDDASWGPKMEGQEYIPWYAWYGDHRRAYQTALLQPQPNNVRDYFQTGIMANNNVVLNKVADDYSLRFSYTNQFTRGLLPSTSMKKNMLSLAGSYALSSMLSAGANINYVNNRLFGEIDDEYSNQSTGAFNQWFHRDLDIDILREYRGLRTADGIYASWNHANPSAYNASDPKTFYAANYWYNNYTYFDLADLLTQRDRFFGDVYVKLQPHPSLSLIGTFRKQQRTSFIENKYSSRLNESGNQTAGNNPNARGAYQTNNIYDNRQNIELHATYDTKIQDLTLQAHAVADFMRANYKENSGQTVDGLNVPDLFTLANSVSPAEQHNPRYREGYNALLLRANLGYKNFLFLDATLRSDWYSTLPPEDNQVYSKSIGASFVFSDLLEGKLPWLSYGKLKYAWGEIPKALGINNSTFGYYRYPGMNYEVSQYKWGNNFLMSSPTQYVDPHIHGAVSVQRDLGLELSFLRNRLGLSSTFWSGLDHDYPYAVTLNGASGFKTELTNIGKISRSGIDVQLQVIPIQQEHIAWTSRINWSYLIKNNVDEITDDTKRISVNGVRGAELPYLTHLEGARWGQIFGNGILRNDAGLPILNASGFYQNNPAVDFGSVLPIYTGGFFNSLRYKDFSLSMDIDYQYGGKMVSLSNMWGSFSGLTAATAAINDRGKSVRDPVEDGGGVRVDGVDAVGQPMTTYIEAQSYYQGLYNSRVFDDFIYDLTFIKLRALSIGYALPVARWSALKFAKSATLAVVANNPWLIYTSNRDFDPSEIAAEYGERGQLPGARGFGFNLSIGF